MQSRKSTGMLIVFDFWYTCTSFVY